MRGRRLELDHVAGREQCDLTATLCNYNCHITKSLRQMSWDSRWNWTTNSDNLSASFLVQGIQELLVQKHCLTGNIEYRILADSLSPLIKYYRDQG